MAESMTTGPPPSPISCARRRPASLRGLLRFLGVLGSGRGTDELGFLEALAAERELAEDALTLRIHNHALAVLELAEQDLLRDGVLDVALDDTAQRTGAQQRVEALLREQVRR